MKVRHGAVADHCVQSALRKGDAVALVCPAARSQSYRRAAIMISAGHLLTPPPETKEAVLLAICTFTCSTFSHDLLVLII